MMLSTIRRTKLSSICCILPMILVAVLGVGDVRGVVAVVSERSSSSSSIVDDRSLQKDPFTFPPLATYISKSFTFEYQLHSNAGGDNTVVQTGLNEVDVAITNHLRDFVLRQYANITVAPVESRAFDTCPEEDLNQFPDFSSCARVNATITLKYSPGRNDNVIERVALQETRNFARTEFNEMYDDYRISYQAPLYVKASLLITMTGVGTTMNQMEQDMFLEVVTPAIENVLEKSDRAPTRYDFKTVEIISQAAQQDEKEGEGDSDNNGNNNNNRNLQDLGDAVNDAISKVEDDVGDTFNNVIIVIKATCGSANCNSDVLQDFLDAEGPGYGQTLFAALQTKAIGQDQFYFLDIKRVVIGRDLTPDLPPASAVTQIDGSGDEKIHPFFWVLLLIDCIILIGAVVLTVLCIRRKKKTDMNQADWREEQKRKKSTQEMDPIDEDEEYAADENGKSPETGGKQLNSSVKSGGFNSSMYSATTAPTSNVNASFR